MKETRESQASQGPEADLWFGPWKLAGFIGLLMLMAYPEVVLGSHSFFYRDFGLFTYPVAWYQRASFWRGEMPLWNPMSDCGLPFLAQWNTSVLYPFSLLYVVFPLPWSLNYFCLGHLMLAGVGMYLLALRWTGNRLAASVAGLAFAWNGMSVHCLMWVSSLTALAWMPWVVLTVERAWLKGGRWLVWASLAGAVQMLGSSPEFIMVTWMVVVTLAVAQGFRREAAWGVLARRLGLVCLLVAGLAAAQLLPFLDLLRHSQRTGAASNNAWAMPPWGWANFIVPLFRCTPSILGVYSQDEQQWLSSYYVGIGVLALAAHALCRRSKRTGTWLVGGLAIAGVVLAMGENEPLYKSVRTVMPILGVMRYPIKLVVLTVFAAPLLAGFGLERCQRSSDMELAGTWKGLGIMGGMVLAVLTGILVYARCFPHGGDSWTVTWRSGASRAAYLVFTLGMVCALGRARVARMRILCGLAILLATGLDGLTHTAKQHPTVAARAYEVAGMREVLKARLGKSRAMVSPQAEAFLHRGATADPWNYYLGVRRALYLNCNLMEEIPAVHGFFPLYLKEEAEVRERMSSVTNAFPEPLADFLGVSEISSAADMFQWQERTNYMPMVSAGQKPEFVGAGEALRLVGTPQFDPRRTVYLPVEAAGMVGATNVCAARVELKQIAAQNIEAEVEAAGPAMVVVAQTFYHPWRAFVDGRAVTIWRANHAFQAVEIPAGRHMVRFEYHDGWFAAGVAITAASLLSCLGLWFHFRSEKADVGSATA